MAKSFLDRVFDSVKNDLRYGSRRYRWYVTYWFKWGKKTIPYDSKEEAFSERKKQLKAGVNAGYPFRIYK